MRFFGDNFSQHFFLPNLDIPIKYKSYRIFGKFWNVWNLTRFLANYNFEKACEKLIPNTGEKENDVNVGPVFIRDEFEDWSKAEVQLFEEGNQKYSKDFLSIRDDFLPWKEIASIIEFYYMWKTSDRCVDQVRFLNFFKFW